MKQRGRFERRHRLPRLHGGKLALLIACLIQTALSVFCFAMLGHVRGMLVTQSAADVWRGDSEDRFAQISAFLPTTETKTLDDIRSFRATLENEFVQNSMEAPVNSKDTWKRERKLKFSYKEQKEYETIEADIEALEQKIEELDAQMLKVASDFGKLNALSQEKEEAEALLMEKMERWENLEDLAMRISAQ